MAKCDFKLSSTLTYDGKIQYSEYCNEHNHFRKKIENKADGKVLEDWQVGEKKKDSDG